MSLSELATQWSASLTRHVPPGQFGRYLLVGAWNTLFGYGTFALFTAVLNPIVPHSYILAAALSNLFNITFSYLSYKRFIFKTRGNYVREWMKCVAVYGGASLFAVMVLPVLVFFIRHLTPMDASAPYLAGGIVAASTAVASFIGHKSFTFRSAKLR